MTIETGTTITHGANTYLVGELIKAGGFGRVFRAQQTAPILRDIALKVPADHVLQNEVWLRKFEREARILANIDHPNVVKVVAFFTFESGERAFAQELVAEAQPLHEYLKTHPTKAPTVFVQSLYAMRAFHGAGRDHAAIHRDLSPANILVSVTGLVKIIDFGLAKEDPRQTEILTKAHEGFGTPGCTAPEQVGGAADVDHRADLYALGRSMTAALQGRNPLFAEPNALPEPWKTICLRLTAHNAEDRYADASAALAETFALFAKYGFTFDDFSYHVNEMLVSPELPGWPFACALHFERRADFSEPDLLDASRLSSAVFRGFCDFGTPLTADDLFERIEAGSALAAFNAGNVAYDDCDPLGRLYAALYPALDEARRLRCFERLVKTALGWHRYAVMGDVRTVYGSETDTAMKATLRATLDRMDPMKVIHGHGVIPDR